MIHLTSARHADCASLVREHLPTRHTGTCSFTHTHTRHVDAVTTGVAGLRSALLIACAASGGAYRATVVEENLQINIRAKSFWEMAGSDKVDVAITCSSRRTTKTSAKCLLARLAAASHNGTGRVGAHRVPVARLRDAPSAQRDARTRRGLPATARDV